MRCERFLHFVQELQHALADVAFTPYLAWLEQRGNFKVGFGYCHNVAPQTGKTTSLQPRFRLPAWWPKRHIRSPDWSMAIGAPWPTIHRRESAGGGWKYCRGVGRESSA